MFIGVIKMKLYAEWVHSLKEKRMIVQSIIGRTRNKFNISIHQVDALDLHQTIVIGISTISQSETELNSVLDNVVRFIESHTEAVILDIEIEVI